MDRLSFLAGVVLLAALACGENAPNAPDAIFRNGRIYTVDAERSWAEALALRGDRVVAIGATAELDSLAGPATRVVDLGGRMVMPGIHDAHTHLLLAGLKWNHECRLPPNAGPDAILEALATCADATPGDGWIVAGEVNPNVFGEAPFDRVFLDEAYPKRPVFLYEYSIHHALVNTRAMELAGIDANTPNPPGGEIRRDPVTGEPTGEILETATALVTRVIPPYPDTAYRDALRFAIDRCHAYGITSVQEASANRRLLTLLGDLDRRGALDLAVTAHLVWGSEKFGGSTPEELDRLFEERAAFATAHVDVDATKVWLDGAPLPPYFSEARLDAESGRPDEKNLLVDEDTLVELLERWRVQGIKPKLHVAGAGAARVALNAIERAYGLGGDEAPPPDLAHANLIDPTDIARFAELGVVAEMSPAIWHLGNVPGMEIVNEWWPFASLHKTGALLTMASDWVLPPDPNLFPALEGLVTRERESLPLADGLELMTRNGAKSVGQLERFGSLEVGKRATFIVLDRNLFEVPPTEIGDTRVLMTVFEGERVFLDDDAPEAWHAIQMMHTEQTP